MSLCFLAFQPREFGGCWGIPKTFAKLFHSPAFKDGHHRSRHEQCLDFQGLCYPILGVPTQFSCKQKFMKCVTFLSWQAMSRDWAGQQKCEMKCVAQDSFSKVQGYFLRQNSARFASIVLGRNVCSRGIQLGQTSTAPGPTTPWNRPS